MYCIFYFELTLCRSPCPFFLCGPLVFFPEFFLIYYLAFRGARVERPPPGFPPPVPTMIQDNEINLCIVNYCLQSDRVRGIAFPICLSFHRRRWKSTLRVPRERESELRTKIVSRFYSGRGCECITPSIGLCLGLRFLNARTISALLPVYAYWRL